jgi:hypothetical protein
MICFRSLKHWARGFESYSRHGCLCAFILFLLFCVQVGALRQDDPSSKESYRVEEQETEKVNKAQKRSVEPQRDRFTFS